MTALRNITNYEYWFLDDLQYREGSLTVDLIEGAASDETVDLQIGQATIENLHPIETSPDSRRFRVVFDDVIFFASYDELQHLPEPTESTEPGLISRYPESRLLTFADEQTNSLKQTVGEVHHYCIRTGEFWVHVLSRGAPTVEALEA